ncbi:MAG TPA: hypothetical protein VFN57_03995 [Thermomicrobiaceae bacterium]|nr:hypothetical protein [Thermomicrobiaceae bacterium]
MSRRELPRLAAAGRPLTPPGDLRSTLLIARRGALEALHDRLTVIVSLFFALVLPAGLVLTTVLPAAASTPSSALGQLLAVYLLIIGLLPSSAAIGVAAGQFAGEKEQGNLTPLLASPASNLAIFGGKVLGSVVPAIVFSVVAELAYLGTLLLTVGLGDLRLLPVGLALGMVALVPASALFETVIASLISSRVRTFNTAQQISGLALIPFWGAIAVLGFALRSWGGLAVAAAVVTLFAADVVLTWLAASTWRREEVLGQR